MFIPESEGENTYTELATVDTLALTKGNSATKKPSGESKAGVVTKLPSVATKQTDRTDSQVLNLFVYAVKIVIVFLIWK